jgi:hypothetical protein
MEVRFWQRVTKGRPDECWLWPGATNGKYGMTCRGGRKGTKVYAHRASWEIANGMPVPDGLHIAHTCDTPLCVNPAHLFAATRAENMADMVAKRRSTYGTRHPGAKLTEADVLEIRRRYRLGNGKVLGKEFGVTYKMIHLIVRGLNWKHLMPPSSNRAA